MAERKLKRLLAALCIVVLALLAGCAKGTTVVLLPDNEGKVGAVTVSNQAGSQTLDQAGEAAVAKKADKAPAQAEVMDKNEINKEFGWALAAQPPAPLHFIIYFKHKSFEPTDNSKALYPIILEKIKKRHSVDISVVGHTDTTGSAAYNKKLSAKRTKVVADYLVAHGVNPDHLEVGYHGEANLLVPTADNVSEPRNRRVEVTVR